jgi:hypothetical protein
MQENYSFIANRSAEAADLHRAAAPERGVSKNYLFPLMTINNG